MQSNSELTIKKLNEALEKLTKKHESCENQIANLISKNLDKEKKLEDLRDEIEYLKKTSDVKDQTISQLNKEQKDAKEAEQYLNVTYLKTIQEFQDKLVSQDEQMKQQLTQMTSKKDESLTEMTKKYDDLKARWLSDLNDIRNEREHVNQKFEEHDLLLQEAQRQNSKSEITLIEQQEKLTDVTKDRDRLTGIVTDLQQLHEREVHTFERQLAELNTTLSSEREVVKRCNIEMDDNIKLTREKHQMERDVLNAEIRELKMNLLKLGEENAANSGIVKELQLTIKANRDFLYTDSEIDLIVAKIKAVRTENKQLKLENLKLMEENDQLTCDNTFKEGHDDNYSAETSDWMRPVN